MKAPSLDKWLQEAKHLENSPKNGMYLFHNGTVRSTSKAYARQLSSECTKVIGMEITFDESLVEDAKQKTLAMTGINYVKIWINSGILSVGDDIMLVLVGGDTRPNVIKALEGLVEELKSKCITEKEIFGF